MVKICFIHPKQGDFLPYHWNSYYLCINFKIIQMTYTLTTFKPSISQRCNQINWRHYFQSRTMYEFIFQTFLQFLKIFSQQCYWTLYTLTHCYDDQQLMHCVGTLLYETIPLQKYVYHFIKKTGTDMISCITTKNTFNIIYYLCRFNKTFYSKRKI